MCYEYDLVMVAHKNKHNIRAFTITELIVLVILIALFWFGFKYVAIFIGKLLGDDHNRILTIYAVLIGGTISGIIPVVIFVGSCICIGMYIKERKKKK